MDAEIGEDLLVATHNESSDNLQKSSYDLVFDSAFHQNTL